MPGVMAALAYDILNAFSPKNYFVILIHIQLKFVAKVPVVKAVQWFR